MAYFKRAEFWHRTGALGVNCKSCRGLEQLIVDFDKKASTQAKRIAADIERFLTLRE